MIFLTEHWFEAASSIQQRFGPITVRPDGIKDERKARQYIAQVVGILRALEAATKIGKAVITSVRFHNRPVLIFPYDGQGGECNAWAKKDWGLFTGTVSFTPFVHGGASSCAGPRGTYEPAGAPHELLLHELTHIVRAVSGKIGDSDEEEIAVMVANMFSAEIHRDLISDYNIRNTIAANSDLAAFSRDYYEENEDMVEAFCRQSKQFALRLALVDTVFNPPRQYFEKTRPPEWPRRR
ncbi:hypothetical protein FHP25_08755 [Vineibacter terrae]|uniref:Uncharacterized protein n=1 Tax=Vineibacter terrae TaxID=2586908 RepID=A0A5C8PQP9_9HYPH|nr:hypothetical protein [Vineibacter terrae]TXL77513.1 hypothetical protein FHP25_08755 [Vineibacter terrae]